MIISIGQCFATEVVSEGDNLCSGARFLAREDGARSDLFNTHPQHKKIEGHTTNIDTFLTTGAVNKDKRASMQTKEAVALAILGTAITDKGQNTDMSAHFQTLDKTHPLYFHYAALYTIESLARDLVLSNVYGSGKEPSTKRLENRQKHFGNLQFLCGIDEKSFTEWSTAAQANYQAGLKKIKNIPTLVTKIQSMWRGHKPRTAFKNQKKEALASASGKVVANNLLADKSHEEEKSTTTELLLNIAAIKEEKNQGTTITDILSTESVVGTTPVIKGETSDVSTDHSASSTKAAASAGEVKGNWTKTFTVTNSKEVYRRTFTHTFTHTPEGITSSKGGIFDEASKNYRFKKKAKDKSHITLGLNWTEEDFKNKLKEIYSTAIIITS